ncbi:MAG: S8 family serine peptidase [Bacteroidia bacterium]
MKQFTTTMLLACLMFQLAFSQSVNNNYTVLFKSGAITPAANAAEYTNEAKLKSLPLFDGKFYALIQFNAIPSESQKQLIANAGIQLLSYIPHNAWIASIDEQADVSTFASLNIRSIQPLTSSQKISEELKDVNLPDHAQKVKGMVDLIVQYYKNADIENVSIALRNAGCEILQRGKNLSTYTVRVNSLTGINQLAALAFVQHIQAISPPPVPDDTKGRSMHRSNVINSDYSGGLHYDGNGVTVAVADDGSISHIDFKGRLTDLTEQGQAGNHGDMTTGICVGAGNLNPVIRGMGTGAHLVLFDIFGSSLGDYPQIVNAVSNYTNYDVTVVSTSYSQGCNVYDNYSQEGDMLLHSNQQLMFCFSAGNNNGNSCNYGAGGNWGNVTGGYKQGKNVTTCANVDSDGVLDAYSSHGPASDGRIKPDISANGAGELSTDENNGWQVGGGTSAASPGVGGCYTQLYQAYKSMNGGVNPDGALIKACILNSANEIGNPGPDYKFGWGQINVRRAYNTLSQSNYLTDSIVQGAANTHTITIPAGTAQVKVMVYWNDVEGSPLASKALVNNLDMTLTDPSSATLLPLVLDPTPNAVTLNANAVPGVDTLNNMEQVTIENPAAGTYTVTVNGTEVPQGPQHYYVVWQFVNDDITVTYPNGGEGFVPGETELLRWDAYDGNTADFTIEYSGDNGTSWTTASTTVPGTARQYYFTVPSTVSGDGLIRVSRNGVNDVNDVPFSIIDVPQNLSVVYSCPDSIGLQWNVVAGATGYEVSYLGAMYMDSIGTTATNSIAITGLNPNDDLWFSVKSLGPNGAKGRRALAIHKAPGTFNCLLASDVSLSSVVSPTQGTYRDCAGNATTPVSIYIKNFSVTTVTSCPVSYSFNGTTYNETFTGSINPYDSALYTFTTTVNLATAGNYSFKSWTGLATDMNNFNDTTAYSINVIPGNVTQPPVTEDFQLGFPPAGYNIVSAGNAYTWEQRTGLTGSTGATTTAAYVNNYTYNSPGAEDNLETRVFDLTGATSNALLTFDVAYAAFSVAYEDGLRIDISNNCGATFTPSGYLKTGLTLSTLPGYNTTAQWAPANAAEWRNDTVMLNAYLGANIIVRFVNINGFGNSLMVDNINVQQNVPLAINELSAQQFGVAVYPNPTTGKVYISNENFTGKDITIKVTDTKGRELRNVKTDFATGKTYQLNLSDYAKGVYFIELLSNDKVFKTKLVIL